VGKLFAVLARPLRQNRRHEPGIEARRAPLSRRAGDAPCGAITIGQVFHCLYKRGLKRFDSRRNGADQGAAWVDFSSRRSGIPQRTEKALRRFFIYLWTFPTTLVGLIFLPLALLTGGRAQWVDGVLEIYGGAVSFFLSRCTPLQGGASAMTLGHVVLGRTRALLDFTRSHERVHVRQAQRWGPLFIPAYLLVSLVLHLRGKRGYEDNPFEREAYDLDER
jgi:hypothetical protein